MLSAALPPLRNTLLNSAILIALMPAVLLGCGDEGSADLAILDVQPRMGSLRGSETVKIVGQGFRSDIGYSVYFGHRPAPRVVIADGQNLLVETPAGDEEGPVEISIRSDDGAAFRVRGGFRYESRAAHGGSTTSDESGGNLEY